MPSTPPARRASRLAPVSVASISGALFLVFLVLKLTGSIGWSWWWITAPLWAPLALIAIVAGVIAVLVTIEASRR